VGYIKIIVLQQQRPKDITEHITKLRNQGMTKIIIDLRDKVVVYWGQQFFSNEFLQKNDVIVIYTRKITCQRILSCRW
jgi:hypothetical protein